MPVVPIGLGLVAGAARRAGHVVSFLDLMHEPDPAEAVRRAAAAFDPQVIGLSIRNIDDQDQAHPGFLLEKVRPVAMAARGSGPIPLVLGGAGFSLFPEAVLETLDADLGIVGDGERAFCRLMDCLQRGEDPALVPGVVTRDGRGSPAPFDLHLSGLPDPADELLTSAAAAGADLWLPLQTRRGCPNPCSYCSTAAIQGRVVRSRPPEEVAAHLAMLSRRGFDRFYFVDNNFNVPEVYALELCRAIEDLRIRFRAILLPRRVSPHLVAAMARAGCTEAALGFESGSAPILHELGKTFTPDDIRITADLLRQHDIRRAGFLLLGGPGETPETASESLAFARSLNLDSLRITVGIRIYPGTPLHRRAIQEGVIGPEDNLLRPRFYLSPALEPWLDGRPLAGFYPDGKPPC